MPSAEYDRLAEIYDVWSAADPASGPSHDFYVGLLAESEPDLVEIGVGDGRIAVDVALRGRGLTGVDISPGMLARCTERAAHAGVAERLRLIRADVRSLELPRPARTIVFPFRSIGHLLTAQDKRTAFDRVYANLEPGGRFVLDHYVWDETWARHHDGVPRLMHYGVEPDGSSTLIWDTYRYDFGSQRMACAITVEHAGADGRISERFVHPLSFSWFTPEQAKALAESAGFEVVELYGDFARTPFWPGAANQVWVLRRPH